MDVTSLASYAMYADQAMFRQELQVSMVKQTQEMQQAAVNLVASATGNADMMVPTAASSGVGTIIDITV